MVYEKAKVEVVGLANEDTIVTSGGREYCKWFIFTVCDLFLFWGYNSLKTTDTYSFTDEDNMF